MAYRHKHASQSTKNLQRNDQSLNTVIHECRDDPFNDTCVENIVQPFGLSKDIKYLCFSRKTRLFEKIILMPTAQLLKLFHDLISCDRPNPTVGIEDPNSKLRYLMLFPILVALVYKFIPGQNADYAKHQIISRYAHTIYPDLFGSR